MGKGLADLCLCFGSSLCGKREGWLEGVGLGETVPTVQLRDADSLAWGRGRRNRNKGMEPRNSENGWTWNSIGCVMKEMEVTRRAAGFLVWGHIGWLQVTETQLKLPLTLEHHGLELCGSTYFYTDVFQSIYSWPSVSMGFTSMGSTNRGSNMVFLINSWES